MEITGYFAALLIGITMGLIGGGGSILTIPVLVYFFHIAPLTATSYSLFIVGVTSLVGAGNSWRKGWMHLPTAFLFGVSSVITVFLIRKFVIPILPEAFYVAGERLDVAMLTMVVFALLMLASSISMITQRKTEGNPEKGSVYQLLLYGVGIGLVTGFLGAGGGFLIVPALVLILKLPMKKAIGTSLLIIALNSTIGFLTDLGHFTMNWKLLLSITALAIAGVFIGGSLGKKIQGAKLKKGFGWFVLLMAVYILLHEILLK
jgi:uncharacterized membrane protein YfcA